MSKIIASLAISGAHQVVGAAQSLVTKAVAAKGADCAVGFPDTAYALPVIYSLLGQRVERLADMEPVLEECRRLLPPVPEETAWLPYLGNALDAGMAALFACELIEACKYLIGPHPVNGIWLGAAGDVIIRERGIEFVDGSAPGVAAVVGAAPSIEDAVRIARELQEKNLYAFIAGETGGVSFAEQLAEAGVQLGWETRLVPFGKDISAAIYALGFASRVALSFGGVRPGDYARNLAYNKDRTFAFVMALGAVSEAKCAAAAGALCYGFPTIADTVIPQILPSGICTYEHVVGGVPIDRIVEKCLEVRGCKVKVTKVPIPVGYGAAFEGERIRKEQVYAEFGGNRTPAFEYVTTRELGEIEDGAITVVGPDIDEVAAGSALPLGIWVEVAGRKMQSDFEAILERQIHHMINGAEGIWHMGQRDMNWMRISQSAHARGFRIRHFGEIIRARFLNDYPAIVDKVQVTLYTRPEEVEGHIAEARQAYRARNQRMASLTDDSVDTFYSCLLCQSFAPNHVCVITPERVGLCGAYNWLDGKAAYEIDPTGPNQPLLKGTCLDPVRGQWANINQYVYANSKQTIEVFNAYSLLDHPMTSCGCFESIVALLPECNGVMIVNREYAGDTPAGMKFSTLANMTGGGQQVPGFIGVGKAYVSSRKFIAAEGGHQRIVWMPRELKDTLREDLEEIGRGLGIENFVEMIADETIGTDAAAVRAHMERVNHPALAMWDVTAPSPEAAAVDSAKAPVVKPVPGESQAVPVTGAGETPVALVEPPLQNEASVPAAAVPAPAVQPSAPNDEIGQIIATLERVRSVPLRVREQAGMSPEQQIGVLQASTALHLLHAGANMLLIESGLVQATAPSLPALGSIQSALTAPSSTPAPPEIQREWAKAPVPKIEERPISSARIAVPTSFSLPPEKSTVSITTVTLGGSGTRSSAVTIGGAEVLPFRYFEGNIGHRPVVAMEVFDQAPKGHPECLRAAYGDLLNDAPAMARFCVEQLGAEVISVRLLGTHPENGNKSPEAAADVVKDVLKAVGVPLIITGVNHFEKNNAVIKHIAATFAGENLLLNWVETDNYKTIAAAALGYGHCVVAQTPIDVNMCKQLNILLANMGLTSNQVVIDPLTSALGYGLEYTYSVMERIRTSAFTGDPMLAMPMLSMPGYEVFRTKESRAARSDFPLWGSEKERGALLEIATAMSFLNSGADLLVLYHPVAVQTMKRKIREMTFGGS
ncbi:MAG: acetyl-CoA decarbonylase/synthase complex subunit alpha/beta [Candidatus Korobacteraceae bacterium]|jgi:acetyl-CoA synthase